MSDRTLAERLKDAAVFVTKDWAKQRKAEERHASALANRRARLVRASDYYNFKSAAFEVMERAYMAASANGTLPASARQVMYQARPFIQEKMGGQQLNDQYFCQQLLPDYMAEYKVAWDVTYDDRGHFIEPHTGHSIGLGTIGVRDYLASIDAPELAEPSLAPGGVATRGPSGCFGAVLFIEKEGFLPLLEAVHLAERYDLAIMSTKGMSSTAARTLIDNLCKNQVPLLVLHDLDKAGFSIVGTLQRDTRRFVFGNQAKVIDLGLRLADVRALDLEASAEDVFDRGRDAAKLENLRKNGATRAEAEFLLTQRIELNALTSNQLVAFIERKLRQYGVKKVMPAKDMLAETYRMFARSNAAEQIVQRELNKLDADADVKIPPDLSERLGKYLKEHPQERWVEAVKHLARREAGCGATSGCARNGSPARDPDAGSQQAPAGLSASSGGSWPAARQRR